MTLPILQAEPVAKLNIEQAQRQLWEKKTKNLNFLHKALQKFLDDLVENKVSLAKPLLRFYEREPACETIMDGIKNTLLST